MPSEQILNKKKDAVSQISDKIKSSYAGVLVNFKGIDVESDTMMRKELRESGVSYFVLKNSTLRFASKEAGLDLSQYLEGTTALALSKEDPIIAPKIICKYLKDLKETDFSVKAGFMDGEVIDEVKVKELGSLPSKEQLIGMLVGLLVSPMRSLAVGLDALSKKTQENGREKPVIDKKTQDTEKDAKDGDAKETKATKSDAKDGDAKETKATKSDAKDGVAKETKSTKSDAKDSVAKETKTTKSDAKDSVAKETKSTKSDANDSVAKKTKDTKSDANDSVAKKTKATKSDANDSVAKKTKATKSDAKDGDTKETKATKSDAKDGDTKETKTKKLDSK